MSVPWTGDPDGTTCLSTRGKDKEKEQQQQQQQGVREKEEKEKEYKKKKKEEKEDREGEDKDGRRGVSRVWRQQEVLDSSTQVRSR